MIANDKPQEAPPATPEERKKILDELSKYISKDSMLTLDGEQCRGTYDKDKESKQRRAAFKVVGSK